MALWWPSGNPFLRFSEFPLLSLMDSGLPARGDNVLYQRISSFARKNQRVHEPHAGDGVVFLCPRTTYWRSCRTVVVLGQGGEEAPGHKGPGSPN